ncbi:TonB-dependent siderophore receptor [Sphingomonas sp. Root241]|uniref:TonB-dependent siderophore receptor n=1 Tax=Sphingomonas sp. Root241 TaxID=1736501 RepID=UPI0006F2598F|nr:TonB-dependent receptor [Sphingomonas sp. Root241]KRC81469.1 hypothetical protein ASE13_03500 [Sphingomonas sp. Root241]
MRLRAVSIRRLAAVCTFVGVPASAFAQRASDNAVTAAEDAFGTSIGNESIGLYSASSVRGFSPVSAGNVRLDGVYLDRQGSFSQRLISGSTVRVGLAARGYPFPAPTGIVDYSPRPVGDRALVSVVAGSFGYASRSLELDGQLPVGAHLGLAGGVSISHDEYFDGADATYFEAAIIPRWRPSDALEIIPFWSTTVGKNEEVTPTLIMGGSHVPPQVARRHYFGQSWAAKDTQSVNTGVIVKSRIGNNWAVTGGVFRSTYDTGQNYAQDFLQTTPEGGTIGEVTADPGQRYASTSGELRVSRSFTDGPRLHTVHVSVRARSVDSRYGGEADPIAVGATQLGQARRIPYPRSFAFGELTSDHVSQTTIGIAYEGRWKNVGELSLGAQRADYSKTVDLPGTPLDTTTRDRPWLLSASGAVYLSSTLALYGSYTRGLEESGLAPNSAANRNQALPAIRTRQADAGLRWAALPRMTLVAGVFDVRKPYFNTDERNVFTTLGDVRHRGVELSLAGNPTSNLNLVAGAVLMEPRVTGPAVDLGRVGRRPLGQPSTILRGNANYSLPFLAGFSIDAALSYTGRRVSSRDNLVSVDPYVLLDLGARYQFKIGKSPATLRVQLQNVTDSYAYKILGSNTYGLMDKRRINLFLAADF